ncbi:MAG: hypothetical protein M3238_00850, partial [Actinomycetota bacterium]|nr:hypothetical protein [Actinomycetota bacterium]
NALTFTYDAGANEITGAASSIRHTRNDRVVFTTTVADRDAEPPLVGTIRLRLIDDKPVTYDGTFTFVVVADGGETAVTSVKQKRQTLRPQPGKRGARLRFLFDVPSGDYSVRARYDPAA